MTIRSINPHRPSDVVHEFEAADEKVVGAAILRARRAYQGWAEQPAAVRGQALARIAEEMQQHADQLARLEVREVGKPIQEATAEVTRAISIFRYYAQMVLAPDGETYPAVDARAWLLARRYPVGVCVLITPWNFPVAIPCWKAAPALAYGNAVVLKPASAATAIAEMIEDIAAKHLPEDVLQVVSGDAETGQGLVDHPDVDAISFTGSVEVGRSIAQRAAGRGVRVQCEMGGQNPSLVLADADLDRAASTIAYAAMGYAGQKCTATSRAIVAAEIYEDLRDRLVAQVEDMKVLDPEDVACQIGPVISESSRASALDAVREGGGRVLTGGRSLDAEGYYLAPTLVEVDDSHSLLAQQEVFAPVAAILKAGSVEEAIRMANDVPYGLVAALFTRDLERALTWASRLEAGLIRVNAPTTGVDFHAPFGGEKASAIGPKEQGLAARDFYTKPRTILVNP